jgi:hypothetical protein
MGTLVLKVKDMMVSVRLSLHADYVTG